MLTRVMDNKIKMKKQKETVASFLRAPVASIDQNFEQKIYPDRYIIARFFQGQTEIDGTIDVDFYFDHGCVFVSKSFTA